LNFAAIPGSTSAWSLQLPNVGGPSYNLPGSPGTAAANPALGGYYFELKIPAPMTITPLLDPTLPLDVTLKYSHEKDEDLPNDQFTILFKWIQQIKDSNLLPALQQKSFPIHMQAHASKTGDPTSNMKLSIDRILKLKPYLDATFGTSIEIIPDPRGDKNARPLTGIKPKDYNTALRDDRNVTLYIDEAEAKAALARDQKVITPPAH
jgi:hypothetical protein